MVDDLGGYHYHSMCVHLYRGKPMTARTIKNRTELTPKAAHAKLLDPWNVPGGKVGLVVEYFTCLPEEEQRTLAGYVAKIHNHMHRMRPNNTNLSVYQVLYLLYKIGTKLR